ncbi:MAG: MFS transporter [Bosea sp. (in: a-proteobacteria)]
MGQGDEPAQYPPRRAVTAWMFFDWATQPYFTLINAFIFAPFFATALASNPADGQALWGYAAGFAGFLIALISPVMGGIADRVGPRKPWIAGFGLLLVAGSAMMWFARPGHPAAIPIALTGYIIATIGSECATVFNNAMMPSLVPPSRIGRLSGAGWALGYLGGIASLVVMLALMIAPAETGKTMLGLAPIFGLDPAMREGDRAAGPFTALWFMLFALPMFWLTPDVVKTGVGIREAARGAIGRFIAMVHELKDAPGIRRFLIANMIYQDGLVALFAFGGIYGAGVFGWQATELGVFGILLALAGTVGALVGGRLDDAIGSKPVVLVSIAMLALTCVGILSVGRNHVFFIVTAAGPQPGDGLFGSLPEKVFLGFGLIIGLVAGPMQAASRSLLVRLAPPDKIGSCFGLFALSGKVTSFMGTLLVAFATDITDSQAAGPAVLIVFFAVGAWLLAGVRRA